LGFGTIIGGGKQTPARNPDDTMDGIFVVSGKLDKNELASGVEEIGNGSGVFENSHLDNPPIYRVKIQIAILRF
jgi:hypothetical protein